MNDRQSSIFRAIFLAFAAAWSCVAFAEPVPDTAFGNNGVVDIALPGESYLNPAYVAVLPDRRIAVARADSGRFETNGVTTASFARLLPDGRLDTTFATDGTTTFVLRPTPVDAATVEDVQVRPDGSQWMLVSLLTGVSDPVQESETMLLRLTADGRLDPAFNGGQPVRTTPYAGEKLFVDGNAAIIMSLSTETCCGSLTGLFAQRFLADGTRDLAFGSGGVLDIESTQPRTQIRDAMPVPGGGFQVLYAELTEAGERNFWRRYRANGTLDTTFGAGGDADIPVFDRFGLRRIYPLGDGTWLGAESAACGRRILDAQGSIVGTLTSACAQAVRTTSRNFGAHAWGHRILLQGEQRTGFIALPSDGAYVWATDRDGRIDAAFSLPQDATRWRIPGPGLASFDVAVDGTERFVTASAEFADNSVRVQRYLEARGGGEAQPVPALGLPGVLLLLGGTAALARRRLTRH